MGTAWGVGCGVVTAWLVALVLAVSNGGPFDVRGVMVGVAVVGYVGGIYGAVAGGFFGSPTGLLAGIFLELMPPSLAPRTATWATVVLTMASQLAIGLAVFGPPVRNSLWVYMTVPAVTVVPLALATRAAARDAYVRRSPHRDTLAA